jgi:hypothetical protein
MGHSECTWVLVLSQTGDEIESHDNKRTQGKQRGDQTGFLTQINHHRSFTPSLRFFYLFLMHNSRPDPTTSH